jgi:hypothetical protein
MISYVGRESFNDKKKIQDNDNINKAISIITIITVIAITVRTTKSNNKKDSQSREKRPCERSEDRRP